ncbi:MAG: hypothetical protein ACREK5_06405 [Gemmatimonadota bacterium]
MTSGLSETGFCVWHDGDRAAEATRMRRHGANATNAQRRVQGLDPSELGELESIDDAKRWLRVVAAAASSGRMSCSQAEVAIRAVRAWLMATKAVTDEQIAELKLQVEEVQKGQIKRLK